MEGGIKRGKKGGINQVSQPGLQSGSMESEFLGVGTGHQDFSQIY